MIFLGGAVGKLTPEYWSGEVFFQIYFVDRDFWVFNLLRSRFEPETLREIATYYSRMVIGTEMAVAGFWLLPRKVAAVLTLIVLLCLTLFSNFNLFSVTFCLIGLCLFVLHEPKDRQIK
jgi:lipoprotein signal peptidase